MQLEKKGSRRDLSKQVSEIRAKQGAATYFQKINIEKAFKIEPTALLGILKKLVDVKKGKHPSFGQITRTRTMQSFVASLEGVDYLVSQERSNNLWVVS